MKMAVVAMDKMAHFPNPMVSIAYNHQGKPGY